jgi:hypothetical protein
MKSNEYQPSVSKEMASGISKIDRVTRPITQMNKLAKAINPMGVTFREINKRIEPVVQLKSCIEASQPFKTAVRNTMGLQGLAEEISNKLNPIIEFQTIISQRLKPLEMVMDSFCSIVDQLEKTFAPSIIRFNEVLDRVPVVTKEALLLMAENGWFVDPELTLDYFVDFLSAHEGGDIDEIETALVDFFEERCADIEKGIAERYPERVAVLKAAFNAHKNGQYSLSIPVFLAQADGISNQLMGKHYFRHSERKDIARYVNEIVDASYEAVLLAPLREKSHFPISRPGNGKNVQHLNRHAILHGDFIDYGTRENSLKAISFLNYIAVVFGDAVSVENFKVKEE